jgi:hypothetical protein
LLSDNKDRNEFGRQLPWFKKHLQSINEVLPLINRKVLTSEKAERTTLGLLQGWLDVEAMNILSLLFFIWAGRSNLGFCLLTFTFISLISSGYGRTQQLFQPCKQALPVSGKGKTDTAINTGYFILKP